MDASAAKAFIEVIRSDEHRRVSRPDIDPDVAYDQWIFHDEPFISELCLMFLVALRHHIERELVRMAARTRDGGQQITHEVYEHRLKEVRSQGRKRQGWQTIEAELKVKSCADAASMEVLRLLANSYKHDPSIAPDQELLKLLNLTTTVKYASLPESPDVREGLALSAGLTKEATYCDIAERFLVLAEGFLADVQSRNTLSGVKRSRVGSFRPQDFLH